MAILPRKKGPRIDLGLVLGRERVELGEGGQARGRTGPRRGAEMATNSYGPCLAKETDTGLLCLLNSWRRSKETYWGHWGFTQRKRIDAPLPGEDSGSCPCTVGFSHFSTTVPTGTRAVRLKAGAFLKDVSPGCTTQLW